jgi:hypothetical protein
MECISLVFLSISPETSLGKSVISAEKSIEAAAERKKMSIINTHKYSRESININPKVITISTSKSMNISFLKGMRSMTLPMRGARTTAGSIAIAAVKAMVSSSAPKATIIEKIAT